MKRWKLILLLLVCALALPACGGGKNAEDPPPQETQPAPALPEKAPAPAEATQPEAAETAETAAAWYTPVLNEAYELLYNGYDFETEYAYAPVGLTEAATLPDREERLAAVGYALRDLNGDGAEELLLGSGDGTALLGGYTRKGDQPVTFLEGWSRNSYGWMGGGRFFNMGSGGAMSSMFGTYRLSPEGGDLICEDFYFTYEKDESFQKIGLYHNQSGQWDPAVSEELDLTDEAFFAIMEDLEAQCVPLPMTPLKDYRYTGEKPLKAASRVRVDYLADVSAELDGYQEAAALFPERYPAGAAFETTVVFRADGNLRDFKLLSLTLREVDETGSAVFDTEEVFSLPELSPLAPLAVPLSFPGDIPNNGFSYTDEDGTLRRFTLSMSGMDGSLVTEPF